MRNLDLPSSSEQLESGNQQGLPDSLPPMLGVPALLQAAGLEYSKHMYVPGDFRLRLTRQEETALFGGLKKQASSTAADTQRKDIPTAILLKETPLLSIINERPSISEKAQWEKVLRANETGKGVVAACYKRWITAIALHWPSLNLDFQTRLSASSEGVLRAADRYNPELGYSFLVYSLYYGIYALQEQEAAREQLGMYAWRKMQVVKYIAAGFKETFLRQPTESELERQLRANADGKDGNPYLPLYDLSDLAGLYVSRYAVRGSGSYEQLTMERHGTYRPAFHTMPRADNEVIPIAPYIDELPPSDIKDILESPKRIAQIAEHAGMTTDEVAAIILDRYEIAMARPNNINCASIEESDMSTVDSVPMYEELCLKYPKANPMQLRIAHLALEGKTTGDLPDLLGVSRQAIHQACQRMAAQGMPLPAQIRQVKKQHIHNTIAQAFREGMSNQQISEKTGYTMTTVRRHVYEATNNEPQSASIRERIRAEAKSPDTERVRLWTRSHPYSYRYHAQTFLRSAARRPNRG